MYRKIENAANVGVIPCRQSHMRFCRNSMYTKRTQEHNRCVSLKGLSHDMDLAFDDINGYFLA